MKKKTTLMTIIIAISSLCSYSQILSNTKWSVYDSSATLVTYINFNTDTLSSSPDNIFYNNFSTYQESGNNISFIDIPGGSCLVTDTGRYTFLIHNDTLKFTLVSDLCTDRTLSLCTFYWIRLHTGIQGVNLLPALKIYPNPASDKILIKSNINIQGATYIISDQVGRQVLIGRLTNETTTVDINKLENGIYFLQIGEPLYHSYKLIKK